MQRKNDKSLQIRSAIGKIIKKQRLEKQKFSCNKLEEEYDISKGHINKIEKGNIDCKVITMWKIAEALDMNLSDLIKLIEEELGQDFNLIDI